MSLPLSGIQSLQAPVEKALITPTFQAGQCCLCRGVAVGDDDPDGDVGGIVQMSPASVSHGRLPTMKRRHRRPQLRRRQGEL